MKGERKNMEVLETEALRQEEDLAKGNSYTFRNDYVERQIRQYEDCQGRFVRGWTD